MEDGPETALGPGNHHDYVILDFMYTSFQIFIFNKEVLIINMFRNSHCNI